MSEYNAPSSASGEGSPSIVSRKVGAGIQARLARLQGAAGAPVVAREVPRKFANGYDEPFRERLDGTLRRSLSGTWSVHTLEADTSTGSTDGSQTLVDVQSSPFLPTVGEVADLKRRREYTKSWEKQQEAVVDQLLSPEPPRIQMSPQPIMEEPEAEEEAVLEVAPEPVAKPEPAPPVSVQDDPKHGILTPPISEPETVPISAPLPAPMSTPVRKTLAKTPVRPHTTSTATRLRPPPSSTGPPTTPTRTRPRASAPVASSSSSTLSPPISRTLAPPPVPRLRLTPSPARPTPSAPSAPQRAQTSMSFRRSSAPARPIASYSSKVPAKVVPPPVRPRTISKVYEGPTISSLAKQRPTLVGTMSRAVSRAGFS